MLIARSRVKEIAGEYSVANEFFDAIEKKTEQLIKEAIERAKANKRHTVMARDL